MCRSEEGKEDERRNKERIDEATRVREEQKLEKAAARVTEGWDEEWRRQQEEQDERMRQEEWERIRRMPILAIKELEDLMRERRERDEEARIRLEERFARR